MATTTVLRKSLADVTGAPKRPEELARFIDTLVGAENWTYQYKYLGDGYIVCTLVVNGIYRDGIGNRETALYNAALMHGMLEEGGPSGGGAPIDDDDGKCIDAAAAIQAKAAEEAAGSLPEEVEGEIADRHVGDPEGSPAQIHADPRTVSKNEGEAPDREAAPDPFAEAAEATKGVTPKAYGAPGAEREERVTTACAEEIEAARQEPPAAAKDELTHYKCVFCGKIVPPSQVKKCREAGGPILHGKPECRDGYRQRQAESAAA